MENANESGNGGPTETPAIASTHETAYGDFMRRGYVLIPNVLDEALIDGLKTAIDKNSPSSHGRGGKKQKENNKKVTRHVMFKRVFEQHPDLCLQVFKNEKVLPTVKRLLGCCGSTRGKGDTSLEVHIIHNNAFRVDPGMRGQAPGWHTDDPPIFQTTDGQPLPETVKIAPLVLTCMYFLNDIVTPEDGGTRVIEGSHRFGMYCTNENASKFPQSYTKCPAGSVLIMSAHTWHRGSAVGPGGNSRYVFQATYGRRLVGHKHGTIMNYVLPAKVEKALKTEEDKRLMGFLQGGAYS